MSELKLWKNPMTTPSKADVLKVAGEPVAWLWETAAETGIQRARPHPNLGVAVVPLYTETKLLAMYAKGAEAMRERAALACDEQADEPECQERAEYCADAIRALLITRQTRKESKDEHH
jgi:hypothetical protein